MPGLYISETLKTFPCIRHHVAPLGGIELEIYTRLCRTIIDCKLRPGAKLREDVICDTFNVSRTVVRKVLVIMEQQGIVELPANRGAYVARPTPEQARQSWEVAQIISVHVASKLAAPGMTIHPDHIDRIRRQIAFQSEVEARGNFGTVRIVSGEFHVLLTHIYGNQLLSAQIENIMAQLALASVLYLKPERKLNSGAAFQQELLDRVLAHDQAGAIQMMLDLYQRFERSFRFEPVDESDEYNLGDLLTQGRGHRV